MRRVRKGKRRQRNQRLLGTCKLVSGCSACISLATAVFFAAGLLLGQSTAEATPGSVLGAVAAAPAAVRAVGGSGGGLAQLSIPVAAVRAVAAAAAAEAAVANAAPPPKWSWLWQSSSTSTHFAKASPGKWVEVAEHDGEPVHFYEEQSASLVREVVVLVDESRQMEVRLDPTHASFRAVRRGAGFEPFTQGRWATIEGQAAPAAPPAAPRKPPPPHLDGMTRETAKIFVGIAAHRDSMCGNTLKELFGHAKHPERIFPAVVQQNQPGDMDCIAQYCKLVGAGVCRRGQVRIKRVDPAFVKGVMPARFASELLIRDETFCLQIDSHMAAEDDWVSCC